MADGYWNQQQHLPRAPKRPRPEFEALPSAMPSGHGMHGYMPRDDDRGIFQSVKDTETIDSAYDRYLQSVQMPSVPSGEAVPYNGVGLGRARGNAMPGPSMGDPLMGRGGVLPPDFGPNGRPTGYGKQPPFDGVGRHDHDALPLPRDASNTLYVEGLPSNCSRREVAHIFRPFVGYKEVRLVTKESKHRNGDPVVLCFVDFINPACAATALSALQGYRMDETDPESKFLRLQFSRNPGPRPVARGRR
ncbi:PREDICTED: nuclear speckle RNA-binding protein B-like [Tarenaya hassleriana]|uniref:nuclear speckle RNA-binding protein B-like n=1 Tax=Tarenaya hassleriana TaxID=28532 RepID=UPI00053C9C24|nr:PREDICTED: nuclear speckle RNA-binding protein B-like [Tarenaya hassleriana]